MVVPFDLQVCKSRNGWLRRSLLALAVVQLLSLAPARADEAEGLEFFEKHIRPVLVERCYKCHSVEGQVKGGLLLDTRDAMRAGGDSGAAVVPHKPDKSLLLEAVKYESLEMPPDGKLNAETIALFEKWIALGAPDPRTAPVRAIEIEARQKAEINWDSARQFWAFQPPTRHAPPTVSRPEWVAGPIDAFVLARLDSAALLPNEPADDRVLLRRLCFDLVGLPPTFEQSERFLALAATNRPLAIEQLVDELLTSPNYGERWAALWLDIARYAEDQAHIVGTNNKDCYPNAYLYRDWVIGAFNRDLPYDEFLRLQLAADLISPDDPSDDVALGFIGLGPKYYQRGTPEVMADEWDDRVDTVFRGLQGLTVSCARCHDHKFDPIPTEDYYAVAGVFASTEMFNRPLREDADTQKDGHTKKPEDALHIIRDKEPLNLHVFIRGDVHRKGEEVPRRFLHALSPGEPRSLSTGSGRAELADCIANRGNPLTARVIVNRIWASHFGQPLVGTPSNFGALGEQPTHRELLDDLAVRFMDAGWSLKWLHREIVLSSTYQQGSAVTVAGRERDAANTLLWRMNRRRLTIEQWRDAVLATAGVLDPTIGGKSLKPDNAAEHRRTIYSERHRLHLNRMLAMFDFPDPNAHAEKRNRSTTSLQKLFVLNSPFMLENSRAFASRLETDDEATARRVARAYRSAFGRLPSADEASLAEQYLHAGDWPSYAQILLASNEFLILD